MEIIGLLFKSAKKHFDKTAVISSREEIMLTYGQLVSGISDCSSYLSKIGISAEMNVAIKMKKSEKWALYFFALLHIGANPVLIESQFTDSETSECMRVSKTDLIITDRMILNISNNIRKLYLIDETINEVPDDRVIVVNPGNDYVFRTDDFHLPEINKNMHSKIILFTYRGFGYPLAAEFDESSLINGVKSNIAATGVNGKTVITDMLPSSHIFSLTTSLLSILFVGGTVVMINNVMPGEVIRSIDRYGINIIIAVPTLIRILAETMKKKKYVLNRKIKGMVGGNSLTEEIFKEWRDITGGILVQGYGLTETCPVMCNDWSVYRTCSIGKPMPGVKAKIVSDGKKVKNGERGILFIKRKGMMTRYMNLSVDMKPLLTNGWFDTGDIVSKGKDGYFYFHGRAKDIAKIGGVTVDIKEIIEIIKKYDGVMDVSIGIADDRIWQEKLVCHISCSKDIKKEDLIEYLRNKLSTSKIPKEFNITSI